MLWCFIHLGFSKDTSSSSVPSHLPLSLTLRPYYTGSDRSNHVSQSQMSSFFFDTDPLSTAWYSGLEIHAPSQFHQLWSECRTMAWRNGGIRKREKGDRKRERVSRSAACWHPSGTKASGCQREREQREERMRVKAEKRDPFHFSGITFLNVHFLLKSVSLFLFKRQVVKLHLL